MKTSIQRAIILLTLYLVIPLLFVALYFVGNLYELKSLVEPYNLSIIAGASAYMVFMSQFLISARLRFLERIFGQDRLLKLHGVVGFVSGALVLSHFVLKYMLIIRYGTLTLQSALGFTSLLIFALLAPLAYFVLQGRRTRLGPVDYEKARITHNLFALAGLLAVIHVLLATSTWSLLLQGITVGWGIITLGAYVWHKMIRPRKNIPMELSQITEIAPAVHRFLFTSPDGPKGQNHFAKRRSGQFAYFRFEGSSPVSEEHPFTISSPAGDKLEIIVRSSGDYSGLINTLPQGNKVRLDGPYGRFHPFNLPEGTPLLFLAGGIGITPFLSMAQDSLLRKKHPITLVWSIPGPDDEPVIEPLAKLAAAGEMNLDIVYTRKAPTAKVTSRIDRQLIHDTLENMKTSDHGTATPDRAILGKPVACFLCGPGRFVKDISAELRGQGIAKSRIFSESFSW